MNKTEQLPAIIDQSILASSVSAAQDQIEASLPISHYVWIIKRQSWKIAAFVAACLVITLVISKRLEPVYEATSSINIDRQAPTQLVGDDSQRSAPSAQDADEYIATQIKIIQSDAVLRPVAMKFQLLRRERQLKNLAPRQIETLVAAPTRLKQLTVKRPPNTYLVHISYRSTDPKLSADVANEIAKAYLAHIYRIQIDSSMSAAGFMEKQLDELKAKMERSSQALAAFEKELNVINPEQKTSIISSRLLQLNTEYTTAQADRLRKEALFNAMKSGALAVAQISGQGQDLQKIQDDLNAATQKLAQLKATRGPNHPDYRKTQSEVDEIVSQYNQTRAQTFQRIGVDYQQALDREKLLQQTVAQTKAEFDKINENSFEYQRLKQEADADKKLYEELVTKIREAGINAGFQNRNTVISDYARPASRPVFPDTMLNLLVAGVLAALMGVGFVLLLDSFDTTVRDPEEVSRLFQTELIGALPLVRDPKALLPEATTSTTPANAQLEKSFSSFEESVRMLRNSILLGDFDRRLRSILFTSATPGEGKSTTAVHLAVAHAQQGKRTLLIDADLRRPTLHKRFNMASSLGLSTVLIGGCKWSEAISSTKSLPSLDFLPAGPPSRRAADLLGSEFTDLLDDAGKSYDLVIIDAPPLLGFAEPMQLALAADGVVVVAVAGETNRKAINAVIGTLRRLKANVLGLVLNKTSKDLGSGYYYYHYEHYYGAESLVPALPTGD
jgi:capsular exopolysaccharide synthesis family protein